MYCYLRIFDFGSCGSNNDWCASKFFVRERVGINKTQLPPDEPLDGCAFSPLLYYLLGNDNFPLKKWLIKPYPGKN